MRKLRALLLWASLAAGAMTPAAIRAQQQSGAVSLSLYFKDGMMKPLTFYGNPPRYINEIDIVATTSPKGDDGIDSLKQVGAYSKLDWTGVKMVEEDWRRAQDG